MLIIKKKIFKLANCLIEYQYQKAKITTPNPKEKYMKDYFKILLKNSKDSRKNRNRYQNNKMTIIKKYSNLSI